MNIFDTPDALATAVAQRFVTRLAEIQAEDRTPQVVLTGGGIAGRIHRAIADSPGDVDWRNVEFWWGDDRFVEEDSADRNERQAREAMLDALGVKDDYVHPMPADDGRHVDAAALFYAEELRNHPAEYFDIVFLGLGPDGHIASIFPDHGSFRDETEIAYAVTDSPKPPPTRVTLSLDALNDAEEIWFVVAGAEKAEAVARVSDGDQMLPGAHVHGRQVTHWFVDDAAASEIRK